MTTTLSPSMPLVDFAVYYSSFTHGTHRRPAKTPPERTRLLRAAKDVSLALGRTALVSDLNQFTLDGMLAYWRVRRTAKETVACGEVFKSFWRFAEEEGLASGAPQRQRLRLPPLDTSDNALWTICERHYFPASLRIQTPGAKARYHNAVRHFSRFLGRAPTKDDLTTDNLIGTAKMLLEQGRAPATANGMIKKLRALWEWMARRRLVEQFPTVQYVKMPKRIPKAWTREEVGRLFASCDQETTVISGVPAAKFWRTLHLVLWDTAGRIGEILSARWEWLDFETGHLDIAAEFRKGAERDMTYVLHGDTLAALREMREPARELIFPWDRCIGTLYGHYKRILKRAGLDHGRKSKFHRMRRSVASHLQAAGYNASTVLAHSTPEVTRDSYLDPHIVGIVSPSAVLFRPAQAAGGVQ